MSKSTVTAADVREYFRADEKRMSALSEQAQRTVQAGARGKVSPEAIKKFNVKRRKDRRYVVGASSAVKAQAKAQRSALIEQGLAGKRGPLSKAAKAALAQPKA